MSLKPIVPGVQLGSRLKTFAINLQRRDDRRAHIQSLCAELGLDFELVEAVDGRALAEQKGSYFEVIQASGKVSRQVPAPKPSTKRGSPVGFGGLCPHIPGAMAGGRAGALPTAHHGSAQAGAHRFNILWA